MACRANLTNILKEMAKIDRGRRVVLLNDGEVRVSVSQSRWKYLLDIHRKGVERRPEEFLKALASLWRGGNIKLELTEKFQKLFSELYGNCAVEELKEALRPLRSANLTSAHICFQLRRLSRSKHGSEDSRAGVLHVTYEEYDLAKRSQLMNDYLEPLKARTSRREYKEVLNETLKATESPILQFYGEEPEILREYTFTLKTLGFDLKEYWRGYVFKNHSPKQDSDIQTLTFRNGHARFGGRHGSFSPSLKAELTKKLTVIEFLDTFEKIVRQVRPLKLILNIEVETELKSIRKLRFDRPRILEVDIKYYTESFGSTYSCSYMFPPPSYSFGCGGNDLEELIAFLQLLGY